MRQAIITIGLAVLYFSSMPVQAEQIKIGLTGQIDLVMDSYNLLESKIHKDDLITGFYIYDLSIPDSNPQDFASLYVYTNSPNGMSLSVGGITFQTNPNDVLFTILLSDYGFDAPLDAYHITSYHNSSLTNNLRVDNIDWYLFDNTGNALSSPILSNIPPELSLWQDNAFMISGSDIPLPPEKSQGFQVNGHITSVYLIPEPATLLLLGIGGFLLGKRK